MDHRTPEEIKTSEVLKSIKGNHKYAIVQLVMNKPEYVISAAVLKSSIQKHMKTPCCDFICLYNNISENDVNFLKNYFDHVIEVTPIAFKVDPSMWKRFAKNYEWLDTCFTKFYVYQLIFYDKILFLDSDMLCFEDISSLFGIYVPAGSLTSKFKAGLQSGVQITPRELLDALITGYGISACCFLIQPSNAAFAQILQRLVDRTEGGQKVYYEDFDSLDKDHKIRAYDSERAYYRRQRFNAGPDEQLLTWLHFNRWTNISRQYSCLPWLKHKFEDGKFAFRDQWLCKLSKDLDFQNDRDAIKYQRRKVFIIHYVSEKPWSGLKGSGELWYDYRWFFEYVQKMEQKDYVLKVFGDVSDLKYKTLKECDEIYENDHRRKYDRIYDKK